VLRFVEEIIAFTFMSYNETVMKDLLRIIPKKGKVVEGKFTGESEKGFYKFPCKFYIN
jgi:hypothetical protein